jgi:hypothetical protein
VQNLVVLVQAGLGLGMGRGDVLTRHRRRPMVIHTILCAVYSRRPRIGDVDVL